MGRAARQHEAPDFGPKYTELDRRKALRIIEFVRKQGRSESELARLASMPASTANTVLAGKYSAAPTKKLNALQDAMKAILEARRPRIPFAETSVYRLTVKVCDRARAFADTDDVGVLFGVVGVGKTTALKEYARRHPGTIYLRAFDQMTISVLLNRLVWATDARLEQQARFRGASNADKVDAVIQAVRGTDTLIVMDESTRMARRCIETLRDIADDAQIGLVLAGREHLEPTLQDELGRFGEISSRIGFWPQVIRAIEEDDCHLIARGAHGEALTDDTIDMYWQCCAGSARALEKLIASVQRYCQRNKCAPSASIVSNAWTKTMRPKRRREVIL